MVVARSAHGAAAVAGARLALAAQDAAEGPFLVTIDRVFTRVLDGCAAPRPGDGGTWLGPPMLRA